MDFSLTKQEELFLLMIREFAENEVKPLAAEIDEEERFPMETVKKMGEIGLMGWLGGARRSSPLAASLRGFWTS